MTRKIMLDANNPLHIAVDTSCTNEKNVFYVWLIEVFLHYQIYHLISIFLNILNTHAIIIIHVIIYGSNIIYQ